MTTRDHSLDDLERATRVPRRQIRELVRLGILPAPSSRGRGASYGMEHLDRLRVWKRLRREAPAGTTNEQLRVLIDQLHDQGLLRPMADGKIPFDLIDDGREAATIATSTAPLAMAEPAPAAYEMEGDESPAEGMSHPSDINESALEYLRSIRPTPRPAARLTMQAGETATRFAVDLGGAKRSGAHRMMDRLMEALGAYVAQHAPGVRVNPSRSETWQRVTVGKDLEISARGPLTPDEIQLLETVGQLLQQAIYRK